MDRTTIYYGPASGLWDSENIHFVDDVTMKVSPDLFELKTAGFGRFSKRRKDMKVTIEGQVVMWPSSPAKLLPYGSHQIGQSIFGATDKPFVLMPRNGGNDSGWTVANAAITGLSDVIFTADKQIFNGKMTWTGILANNGDPANLADYLTTSDAGALTGFDRTKCPTGLYTGSWGETYTGLYSEDGFMVKPSLKTVDTYLPGLGTIDMIVEELNATLTTVPIGLTPADILAILGDVALGDEQACNDFVVTGGRIGMPIFTLKNSMANFSTGQTGATKKRIGEIEFETIRTQTTGVLDPLWTFDTVPEA
ncbi:hypothetical protein BH09VER1_BH09VER1_28380 [soil metagenome]